MTTEFATSAPTKKLIKAPTVMLRVNDSWEEGMTQAEVMGIGGRWWIVSDDNQKVLRYAMLYAFEKCVGVGKIQMDSWVKDTNGKWTVELKPSRKYSHLVGLDMSGDERTRLHNPVKIELGGYVLPEAS